MNIFKSIKKSLNEAIEYESLLRPPIKSDNTDENPENIQEIKETIIDYKKAWMELKGKISNAQKYYIKQSNSHALKTLALIEQYIFDIEMEEIYKEGIDNGASEK